MKKKMVLSLLVVAGFAFASEVHLAKDDVSRANSILSDGTFQVEKKDNLFGKWLVNFRMLEQNPGIVALDTEVFLKDGKSLRISTMEGPVSVGVMQTVPVEPSAKYKISFYVKYQNVVPEEKGAFRGIIVNIYNGGNFWFPAKALTGSADWTRYEFDYTASSAAVPFSITFLISNAKGTAWFDDVQIVKVP